MDDVFVDNECNFTPMTYRMEKSQMQEKLAENLRQLKLK
jgi:hypothetical protein